MLLPLKQGLKHQTLDEAIGKRYGCYATSIKTRIETSREQFPHFEIECCYATSIKTRIETASRCSVGRWLTVVMLLPLKQGLKPVR